MIEKRIRVSNIKHFLEHGYFASDFLKPLYYHRPVEREGQDMDTFRFMDVATRNHSQYPNKEFVAFQVDDRAIYIAFIDREANAYPSHSYEADFINGEYVVRKYDFGHIKKWICDAFNIPSLIFDNYVEVTDADPSSPREGRKTSKYYRFETKDDKFGFSATINHDYPHSSWINGGCTARVGGANDMPDGDFCEGTVHNFAKAYLRDGFGYYGILLDTEQKDRIGKAWDEKIADWEEKGWDCSECETRNYEGATFCRICGTGA